MHGKHWRTQDLKKSLFFESVLELRKFVSKKKCSLKKKRLHFEWAPVFKVFVSKIELISKNKKRFSL